MAATSSKPNSFAVYYDRSCPLCRKEIAFYQARSGADKIQWLDVSQSENAPEEISCQQALARFHVRKTNGELVDGGVAFAELWKQLPAFRWAGHIFSHAPGRWLINAAYNMFLPIRPRLQGWFRHGTTLEDVKERST